MIFSLSGRNAKGSGISAMPTPAAPKGISSLFVDNSVILTWNKPQISDVFTLTAIGSSTLGAAGASVYANSIMGLLASYYQSYYPNCTVTNLAVGGYSSYHLLPTGTPTLPFKPAVVPEKNITAAIATNADIILVGLPSNDRANGFTETEYINNLLTIQQTAKAAGKTIFFISTQPKNSVPVLKDDAAVMPFYLDNVIQVYDLLATGTDINAAYDSSDHTHLNDAGHAVLFNAVKNALNTYLKLTKFPETSFVDTFEIYRSTGGRFKLLGSTSSYSYTDATVASNTDYTYAIRCIKLGVPSLPGASTLVHTGVVVPPDVTPPTVLSATVTTATNIRLIFSENVVATLSGHTFKRNGAALAPTACSGSGTTWDFTVPTVVAGETILRSYDSATGNTLDTSLTPNELASYVDQNVSNSLTVSGTPKRVLIEVGNTFAVANPSINGNFWNSHSATGWNVLRTNIIDTTNQVVTGLSYKSDKLTGNNSSNSAGYDGIVGDYPANACKEGIFFTPAEGVFVLTWSIPAGYTAEIKHWGSRNGVSDDRICQIRKQGDAVWQEFNAKNNSIYGNGITISGSGTLNIEVQAKAGSQFAYLGIFDIALNPTT